MLKQMNNAFAGMTLDSLGYTTLLGVQPQSVAE